MRRLALAVAAAFLSALSVAESPPTGKVYRINLVSASTPITIMTEEGFRPYKAFFPELRRLGYVEGKNLVVERRPAEGRPERYAGLAREVIQLKPDFIVAFSAPLVRRFKAATTTIPIVRTSADPVAGGIVTNLARPGGNITGFSLSPGDEMLDISWSFCLRSLQARYAWRFSLRGRRRQRGRDGTG